jgi:uncharacterized membrane protein YdjX (TVP38/TMEM64 family)
MKFLKDVKVSSLILLLCLIVSTIWVGYYILVTQLVAVQHSDVTEVGAPLPLLNILVLFMIMGFVFVCVFVYCVYNDYKRYRKKQG